MNVVVVDLLAAAVVVAYAVAGARTGFVVTTLTLVGFVGGALLGLAVVPRIVRAVGPMSAVTEAVVLVGGTAVVAVALQTVVGLLAVRLAPRLRAHRVARGVDGALGAVAAALVTLVVLWGLSAAIRPLLPTQWSRTLAQARVVGVVDDVMPSTASNLLTQLRATTGAEIFPRVFGGLEAEPIVPVSPPDPKVPRTPGLARAQASIVRVVSTSETCDRVEKGSGWVAAPGRVVTNAHVVAGASQVAVSVGGTGPSRAAEVVLVDPRLDIAVLSVPGLAALPLPIAPDLPARSAAVVAGFPLGGPYTTVSARVRQVLVAQGADIYDAGRVDRTVYSLYATVRPGNSGGPLLSTTGQVVGTVFARSLDDASTGYALTTTQTRDAIAAGVRATERVATGACTKG